MCGIAGIISNTPSHSIDDVKKMGEAIKHRGPDGEGYWTSSNGKVLFAHRRLSVIDLSEAAAQPMHYKDNYTIVYNGELYNYKELKATLAHKGYSFRTQSDTEVILAAYDCYREECTSHFDGMFAFVIWDEARQLVFAARDPFGEKPFYYHYNNDHKTFYFASELKAFKAIGLPLVVDESQLLLYLTTGSISTNPDRSQTFYKDFYKLAPGHQLLFTLSSPNAPEISAYWNLNIAESKNIITAEAIEQFRGLLESSVVKRMQSDVEVGTSLSGGFDSSTIVALINQLPEKPEQYQQHSFTASFPGYEKDESTYAKEVANKFHLYQHITTPDAEDFAKQLEALILHHEEPISSASVFAQFKVFAKAKEQGVTVLLDGQGADELLGGYDRYRQWYLQELLSKGQFHQFQEEKIAGHTNSNWRYINYLAAFFPNLTATELQEKAMRQAKQHASLEPNFIKTHFKKELFQKPVVKKLNDLLLYDSCSGRLEELLRYADRNSMYHGREVRLPFLQKDLARFLFTLPSSFKIKNGFTKWLLRKTMEPDLPANIVWRKDKVGFEPPQKEWMKQALMLEMIRKAKETLVDKGVIKPAALLEKIQPHDSYAAVTTDWRYLIAGVLYK